jgi:tetratricopeptide (TPR) repeat protein
MSWEIFRDSVADLSTLIAEKRLAEALRLVEELLEKSPGSVLLLIKRAMLIQLQEDSTDLPPLEAARESLERAIEAEPDSIEPYIELGNFEYAVADDPLTALGLFEEAASHAENSLKAALIGTVKCQLELGRADEARRTIERGKTYFPNDLELMLLEEELTV